MSTQSEAELEQELIQQLVGMEYHAVAIKNETDMRDNLKKQLEIFNNVSLSNDEFERVLNYLNTGAIYERAKRLRDSYVLKREAKEVVHIHFLDSEEWCKNEYQVTHQISVTGKQKNRYDVTILINGLPLIQIELKKRGTELKVAFHQINRYQRDSYDAGMGLFQYVQIFIISNGVNTKYFSNNSKQSFEQTFFWTDIANKHIADLTQFTAVFLKQCHLIKMIGQYIVLKAVSETLMILRPYQFNAVEALINQVKNTTQNGYIWHTTGSGKTLTSFKASQIIQTLPEVRKILFVVDRKDLDYQTIREFNAFDDGCVDNTRNTRHLVTQFKDHRKLIVTTLQKLNNAIQNTRYIEQIQPLQNEKIVFIFDECHRSQFGETHKNIKKFFKNAQMFGFTGTPIFADNAAGATGQQQTTKSLFGECLHQYVIIDAIRDENVLRFSVEYVGKYQRKDSANEIDITVEAIDNSKELLESPQRLEKIVDYILQQHDTKTKQREFTALFCVSNIATLIDYYECFKRKQATAEKPLTIATIFSYAANEEDKNAAGLDGLIPEEPLELPTDNQINHSNRDKLESFIQDYNTTFNTHYSTQDSPVFYSYYQDIAERVRQGQIDILLVVNMFLTGFDSQRLNTLYVDKNLKFHGLVQAFSRTNRILNEKKSQGNIVCFRNLKQATDEAIALFSNKNASETVLLKPYHEYVAEFNQLSATLLNNVPSVQSVDELASETAQLEFIKQFRELLRLKNVLTSFADFEDADLAIKPQTFEDYKSKYLDLYETAKRNKDKDDSPSILELVDFELSLLHRDEINVAYILSLLQALNKLPLEKRELQRKNIADLLATHVQLRVKRPLIELFISQSSHLHDPEALEKSFAQFWNEQKQAALAQLCHEEKLVPERAQNLLNLYLSQNKLPAGEKDIVGLLETPPKILERQPTLRRVTEKIKEFIEIFIEGMGGII